MQFVVKFGAKRVADFQKYSNPENFKNSQHERTSKFFRFLGYCSQKICKIDFFGVFCSNNESYDKMHRNKLKFPWICSFSSTDPLLADHPPRRLPPAGSVPIGRRRAVSASQIGASPPRSTSAARQPYLFTGGLGLRDESLLSLHSEDDLHREHNNALRYRLYNRLDPGGERLVSDHIKFFLKILYQW